MSREFTVAVHRVAGLYTPTAKGLLERCQDVVREDGGYDVRTINAIGENRERSRRQWEFLATPFDETPDHPDTLRFTVELRENPLKFAVAPIFEVTRGDEVLARVIPFEDSRWEYIDAADELTVDERWTTFIDMDIEAITADALDLAYDN